MKVKKNLQINNTPKRKKKKKKKRFNYVYN